MPAIKPLLCYLPLVALLSACAREPADTPPQSGAAPVATTADAGAGQSATAIVLPDDLATMPAAAPAATAAPTTSPGDAALSAASRAFIDPVTGELRAPTSEELAALRAERAQSVTSSDVRQQAPVEEIQLPGGLIEVRNSERFRKEEKVCVLADGQLGRCPSALSKAEDGRPAAAK